MSKSSEISLESYIDYLKRKMLFISNKEIDEYIDHLKNGTKFCPSKMPLYIQRWISDCLRGEMSRQNAIEINERKGQLRDIKPIRIEIIDQKVISGPKSEVDTGASGGSEKATGCDNDSSVEDME